MAPSSSAAARRAAASPDPRRGDGAPDPRSSRRTPLRVLSPGARQKRRRGNRILVLVSAVLVIGSLMAVVVADDMVAQDQVRLSEVQRQVTALTNTHRELQADASLRQAPGMVVQMAESQLGMVSPGQITDLPQVSLTTPLPVPQTAPDPATATPATTGTTSSTSTAASN